MVNKTMESHVFLALTKATTIIAIFDLWMSHGGFDTIVLVVNYINKQWVPCHVIVGIVEVHETTRVAMVLQLKDLFT
jgi:hypothetical protein